MSVIRYSYNLQAFSTSKQSGILDLRPPLKLRLCLVVIPGKYVDEPYIAKKLDIHV